MYVILSKIGNNSVYFINLTFQLSIQEQCVPEVEASVQDVAISPDGMFLAAVNNRGNCYIWTLMSSSDTHLSTLQPKQKIEAHKRYALRCKFSPDSRFLVTCAGDSTAKLWKIPDFTLYRTLDIECDAWVWDAAFSADSQRIFTGLMDFLLILPQKKQSNGI